MIMHRARQTAASSAPMPNARSRRRGQAPQPRSGAPMAQGLMAPIAIAAPSRVPSVAEHIPNSIGATALIGTSTTLPNYTSLTDVTFQARALETGTRPTAAAIAKHPRLTLITSTPVLQWPAECSRHTVVSSVGYDGAHITHCPYRPAPRSSDGPIIEA
jgi:hypothetical protein